MSESQGSTQPTERTPLIPQASNSHHVENPAAPEPWVDTFVKQLRNQEFDAQSIPIEALCPETLTVDTSRTAFGLIVLLRLHDAIRGHGQEVVLDEVAQHWQQEPRDKERLDIVHGQIKSRWEAFLRKEPSGSEIDHVLWLSFPLNESTRRIRLVDLLALEDCPAELLAHPVIYLSLLHTWKLGPSAREDRHTVLGRAVQRLRSLSTPRTLHLLDLLLYTAYLLLLISYVLGPPLILPKDISSPYPTVREILLMVYSFSQVCRPPLRFATVPAALVLISFISRLPSVPLPDDPAYGGLLVALTLSVLQLHIPEYPSPVFLLPFPDILPLATLVWHGISRIFLPVLLFFLPSVIVALFLLSLSLSDILLHLPCANFALIPAPLETRTTFVVLLAALLVVMICSIIMLILVYPFLSSRSPRSGWDRYSGSVGLDARRAFVTVVAAYSGRKIFPPPFNLLHIFISIPKVVCGKVGAKSLLVWLDKLEDAIWTIFIQPLSLLVGVLYLWGLFV